jgi:hypothetical protein
MSGAEFAAWMAREDVDPLPDRAAAFQRAHIAASLMSALAKRSDGQGWRPADFLPAEAAPEAAAPSLGAAIIAAFAARNARLQES